MNPSDHTKVSINGVDMILLVKGFQKAIYHRAAVIPMLPDVQHPRMHAGENHK